jgi:type VI secretion system FHA domain protein
MAHLQLQLVSGSTAGQSDACKFTSLGGTIGRSAQCDWTLNDTDRYISNKHIAVNFLNNQFVLTDTSSNGVFINDAESPLGKGNTYILRANDKLSLGKFSIQVVEIVCQEAAPTPSVSNSEQSDLLGLVTGQAPTPAATNPTFDTPNTSNNMPLFDSNHSPTDPVITPNSNTQTASDNLGLFDILTGSAEQAPTTKPATNPFSTPDNSFAGSANNSSNPAESPVGLNTNQSEAFGQSKFTPNTAFSTTSNTIPEDWELGSLDADDDTSSSITSGTTQNRSDASFLSNAGHQNLIPDDDIMGETAEPAPQQVTKQGPGRIEQPPIEQAPIEQTPAPSSQVAPAQQPVHPEPVAPSVAPAPAATSAQSSITTSENDAFFETLYEKLGLPKEYIASVDKNKFADELVEILMTSTQGIMSLLAGRSVFKQESRLNMTMIKPQSNNPIKFSLDPSDTLEMLLVKKKPGYMTAKAAYSEALNDIQLHQMAFLSGLQATLSGILGELNPDDIEESVTKKGKSMMGLKAGTQKWEAFKEQQDILSKRVNENLNEILSTHFSDAYEAQINSLKNK